MIKIKLVFKFILNNHEVCQVVVLGLMATIWFLFRETSWPEPMFVLLTVIFSAIAFRRLLYKPRYDDELKTKIARANAVDDWHNNEEYSEFEHIAVYLRDPLVKIVRYKEPIVEGFKEPWLDSLFPDPQVNSYSVSVRYSDNEVITMTVLIVDGGRAFLPLPKDPIKLEISMFELAVCQILNGKSGYDTFEYFKRTRMSINDLNLGS